MADVTIRDVLDQDEGCSPMGSEAFELHRLNTGEFLVHLGAGVDGGELVLAPATGRCVLEHQSARDLHERLDITAAHGGTIDAIRRHDDEQPA